MLSSASQIFRKEYLGLSCINYVFSEQLARHTVEQVLALYRQLSGLPAALSRLGIVDVVPSYTTLAVYLAENSLLYREEELLDQLVERLLQNPLESLPTKTHLIPTCYDGEDLAYVIDYHQISRDELIEQHTRPRYLIAMLGFRPYFPYLLGLSTELHTPRRASPRLHTPCGSVAIGGEQTGIYTQDSPGGWHIIGATDFRDFVHFRPGDYLQFSAL